jgi:hypothetical protein
MGGEVELHVAVGAGFRRSSQVEPRSGAAAELALAAVAIAPSAADAAASLSHAAMSGTRMYARARIFES